MQFYPDSRKTEVDCKYGQNFHGEKPDIRFVSRKGLSQSNFVNEFVQKSVVTIEDYMKIGFDFDFIAVIIEAPNLLLDQLECSLKLKNIEIEKSLRGFDATANNVPVASPGQPRIRFYSFNEVEGVEFGITLVLMCNLMMHDYVMPGMGMWLLTIITTASTKLAIVHTFDNIIEKCDPQPVKSCANKSVLFEPVLRLVEASRLAILVGAKYKYPVLEKMPNTEINGVQRLKGLDGKLILQVDDLFRKSDIKELHRVGVKDVIIVGDDNHSNHSNYKFFRSSEILINSVNSAISGNLVVFNWVTNLYSESSALLHLTHFLHENAQVSASQAPQSGIEKILAMQQKLPSSGACSRWEIWKEKGTEHYALNNLIHAFDMHKNSLKFLSQQHDNLIYQRDLNFAKFDQIEMSKLHLIISKLCLELREMFGAGSNGICFTSENEGDLTLEQSAAEGLDNVLKAIHLNPYHQQNYEQANRLIEVITSEYHIKLAENEKRRLPNQPIIEDMNREQRLDHEVQMDGNISIKQEQIQQQRNEYNVVDTEQTDEKQKRKFALADSICDLAQLGLLRVRLVETMATDKYNLLESRAIKAEFLTKYSFRYVMEALELNPNQAQAKEILSQIFASLTFWIKEVHSLAAEIREADFFLLSRFLP